MQRSEILEPKEQEDSTSASLMMMWSVALTGSKPCQVLSREAIQALADLQSSRKSSERTGTASVFQQHGLVKKHQESSLNGGNGALKHAKKDVPTMDQLIILKLATWLLKRKRSGA